ncbi:MAG: hypothetical protein MZV64_04840 [Ignavibacteriales bacterium]|nr:hypothetical protein [Ignavibacteriales bacterium]
MRTRAAGTASGPGPRAGCGDLRTSRIGSPRQIIAPTAVRAAAAALRLLARLELPLALWARAAPPPDSRRCWRRPTARLAGLRGGLPRGLVGLRRRGCWPVAVLPLRLIRLRGGLPLRLVLRGGWSWR